MDMWTEIDCAENTLTELMTGLLFGRFITPSLFGFHLDFLLSFSFFWICTEQYRLDHLWILLGKTRQGIVRFHMRKICHSFCPFSSGKIFLFLYGKSSANSLLFFRYFPPCSTIPLFTCFSVLYRILLLFGRSGDGVVVWVLSCCTERFNCGVLFWNTSFLIPNEFLFDYIRNVFVNRMISCAGCGQDWCCSELWTGAYSWVEREREIL